MNRPHLRLAPVFLLFFALSGGKTFAEPLSLDAYLSQVDTQNRNISAAKEASSGAELTTAEAKLIYAPTLFAEFSAIDNRFPPAMFPTAYRSFQSDVYTVGVRQETAYGISGSVSYLFSHQGYIGSMLDPQSTQAVDRRFWEGTPKFELTVSLLRNFGGAETRALEAETLSSSLVMQYNQRYQMKATHAEAESAYVRLVSAQQLVHLYQDSFSNAQDILNWNDKRMRRNLGESSDLLQAQGYSEAQKLSLQESLDEERVAARNFNRLRNIDSDTVSDTLTLPGIENLTPPPRGETRDDVRAAQENAKLVGAQATLGAQRNHPTLEAYGSVALNGRELAASDTFSHSFQSGQRTTEWGLRLNIPLALGLSSDARRGFQKERDAADTLVSQKLFEQEVEWKDLVQQLNEAKRRYDIAGYLAKIQKKKVLNERTRLRSGRTTTYQTLIFNIDYNSAEVARIQAQSNVLNILARMRTYGESKI